jgi:hypothetical protein
MNMPRSFVTRPVKLFMAMAIVAVVTGAAGAQAENTNACVWPSLATWLPKAERVVVVRVDRTWQHGIDSPYRFRVVIEDALRGDQPRTMSLRVFGARSMPGEPECAPSTIEVEVGDRLVLGLAPGSDRVSGPVSVAAFLERGPHASRLSSRSPGLRRTTLAKVQAILGLPATDTTPVDASPPITMAVDAALRWLRSLVGGPLARWIASWGEPRQESGSQHASAP